MAKVTVHSNQTEYTLHTLPGETFHSALLRKGILLHAPCGGNRVCKKCKITVSGKCSLPTAGETEFLTDEELLSGVRFACMAVPLDDCHVYLTNREAQTREATPTLSPSSPKQGFLCGIDIGTTTVVVYLYRRSDGVCLQTLAEENKQASFGADVISRIHAVQTLNALPLLQSTIAKQLTQMVETVCQRAEIATNQITFCTIAANTTMLHLLAGLDPTAMAVSPFTPTSLFGTMYRGEQLGLPLACDVYCLPCISAYVGGDITAGIAACEMDIENKTALLIDVGTNGEMAIKKADCHTIYTLATAAGPAFEGAHISHGVGGINGAICRVEQEKIQTIGNKPPIGICGSGLVDVIALMLQNGILEETGYLEEEYILPGAPNIAITPKDIREVQLAKSAICSGVIRLMELANVTAEEIDAVYFAGGLGNHLNPKNAAAIGLIPSALAEKCQGVGNTAGIGAVRAGLDDTFLDRLEQLPNLVTYFELSGDSRFNELFMENMMFEG